MTVRNFILVRDDEISFSLRLQQANGFHIHLALHALMTEWGMVIPISTDSFSIIDYLETGEWPWVCGATGIIGLLLTPDKKLYEFGVGDLRLIRRRIPYGPGGWYTRALSYVVEEAARTSVMLGGTTEDIIKRVENEQPVVPGGMVTLKIDTLAGMIVERYPEWKPLPNKEQRMPLEPLPVSE